MNSPLAPPFKPLPVPPTGAVNVQGPAPTAPPELELLLLDPPELLLLLDEFDPPELELLLDDELDARTSAPASFGAVPLEDPDEEEEEPELELPAFASAPASLPGAGAPELPDEEEPEPLLVEPEATPLLFPRPPPVLLLLGPPPSPEAESSPDEQAAATAATARPKADTFSNRRIIKGSR